ncbi:EamA family transporter [Desulfovibrio sp. UIB00]|uniref:DMT family transporter n=1 Tax=Desulfovibrio sp. UIB00 TaxID=2804314 RepID=UPI001F0DEE46|nr:EamA family transporter [Desulfovibrio sp. UIB00]MCH5144982.1 EamA family transporter [Desulfovibrio sp. UIB00]
MSLYSLKAPLAILCGAFCASTSGTAQALAPEGVTPLAVGAIRLLGGGLVLLLWGLISRNTPRPAGWPKLYIVISAAGLTGYQLFFFEACKQIGVAVCTMVAIGGCPIVVGILGWFFLKEKPARVWYAGTALALCGLAVLTLGAGSQGQFSMPGLGLAVLAACSYAVFLVTIKPMLQRHDPSQIMTVIFLIGGLSLAPLLCTQPLGWLLTPRGALVAADLATLTTSLSFTLVLYGMKTTSAAVTSTLGLAEPIGAAVLGFMVLDEPCTQQTLLGLSCILISMIFLIASSHKSPCDGRRSVLD